MANLLFPMKSYTAIIALILVLIATGVLWQFAGKAEVPEQQGGGTGVLPYWD